MIPEPPNDYKKAGIALLVSGVVNAVAAAGWAAALACMCIGGLWVIPFVFAILEAITGFSMMEGNPRGNVRITAIIGLCVSAFLLNPISLTGEIVALVLLTNTDVEAWLRGDE